MPSPDTSPKNQADGNNWENLIDKIQIMVRTKLWAQIMAGMILGIGVGFALSPWGLNLLPKNITDIIAGWLTLPGHLFMALIQMIVVPLVIASIVLGITSSGDLEYLKRLGFRVIPFFVGTTLIAILIGIILTYSIQPGSYLDSHAVQEAMGNTTQNAPTKVFKPRPLPERIVSLIPTNPMSAAMDKSMLELVIFAVLIGIALISMAGDRSKPLLDLTSSIQELSMKVVSWAMMLAPYAVFGLMAQITIKVGLDAILGMSIYMATVLLGLFLMIGVYLLLVRFIVGMGPLKFLAQTREALLLAFSTSSSAAVMPLSLRIVQENFNVKPGVAQFVIPLGATVNMAGTALYQVTAAVFLTQLFGIELGLGGLALLTATTLGASVGSPSTPGAGVVILSTILVGIGVPPGGIALIIGVDRILDMSRTVVNVTGDLTACVVMERWLEDSSDSNKKAIAAVS